MKVSDECKTLQQASNQPTNQFFTKSGDCSFWNTVVFGQTLQAVVSLIVTAVQGQYLVIQTIQSHIQ